MDARVTESESDAPSASGHGSGLRQALIIFGALLFGGVCLYAIHLYWHFERAHPATENAYLQANYVWISPQIDGRVNKVHIVDNQLVEKGALLFTIDPRRYDAALKEAEAELVLVRQDVAAGKARVEAAKSRVAAQRAVVELAQQKANRSKSLVASDTVSELSGIELDQALAQEKAKLAAREADLAVAEQEYGTTESIEAKTQKAEAAVALAKLKRDWTEVRAPARGYVARVRLREGDVVETADSLFPLVEADRWWVQANFKETGIERIQPGQPVSVAIDMYDGRRFAGTVESLGSSSAASFSLLPAQNTTGNWVKVTQRIPVRIGLEELDEAFPYRIGASASVTVDTTVAVDKPGSSR